MNKILFLDFDGVINCDAFRLSASNSKNVITSLKEWIPTEFMDPVRIARINRILAATGAKVVLSTMWRKQYTIDTLKGFLKERGFEGEVIDITPVKLSYVPRGKEIQMWMREQREKPIHFAIIDDDEEAGIGFDRRFVHTPDGVEDEHVEKAIEILGLKA